jgi:ABC-type bacteriocin/lantibiotic exporter with double-glycine peptidase domain
MRRLAKADVNPIRQRSQFSCVATSTCMALNAVGVKCNEDQVNQVIGAKPMQGARWEEVLACAQYFGCRATLTTPATLTQVKAWTDKGKPVLIAWNPEGRDWSHASLIFDVTGEKGSYVVHVADPNLPNPDKTTREVSEDDFYAKWYEKWPNYLVRRPALMIEREISEDGRQIMASRIASTHLKKRGAK